MGASEADRTLFVGNIDPRVTEELMFELFLQAGPLIKVKIPKDKDGKTKNFAFVNFKHVESVPYAMNLLGGTKLFGRPLKIQFRSGSSHGSQNGSNVTPSHNPSGTGSPTHTPPLTPNTNRFDRSTDSVVSPGFTSPPMAQRSYSTQDDLQRQAVMNNILWQQTPFAGMSGFQISPQSNTSSPSPQQQNYYNQNKGLQTQQSWDPSGSQWKNRFSPQSSYQSDSRHYSRDQRYDFYKFSCRFGLPLLMTGLDIEKDQIIEMACLITDSDLNIVAKGPNLIIKQPDALLDGMSDWCKDHHGKSGLTQAVRESKIALQQAEYEFISFVRQHTRPGICPLAGNSVHADKKFLDKYMPQFMNHLHYRIIDVSTVKELCRRWFPDDYENAPKKKASHRALDDITESIKELQFYREHIFQTKSVDKKRKISENGENFS